MSAAQATVKLPVSVIEAAREEARTMSRSLAGQIEHWVRLGQAVERSRSITVDRVRSALAGEVTFDALGDEEQRAFIDRFDEVFTGPDAAVDDFYAGLAQVPGKPPAGEPAKARRGKAARSR